MIFGKKIKELRKKRGLLQRQLAAVLEIDTPMYSKIERGERKAKREQVKLLSKELLVSEKELLALWLADKVLDILNEEDRVIEKAILYVQREIQG
jgi:transcriptional regulator with XRE-family HTH domain